MTDEDLYNIRMRASAGGNHLSGAERIVRAENIDGVVRGLLARSRSKESFPDNVTIHIERLQDQPIRYLTALNVLTISVSDVHSGREAAARILEYAGVSGLAAAKALTLLSAGASLSGKTMRGAIIMDAGSGERLEPDQERGVRASRFDWTDEAFTTVDSRLTALSLTHHRTREALSLATKVAHAPAVVAELCWSDDPDYIAGYVASLHTGYVRIPVLKQSQDPKGGRVIFIDRAVLNLASLINYLETDPVLIAAVGEINKEIALSSYFDFLDQR